MVPSNLKSFLAVVLLLLPIAARGDYEYEQEICTEVNCGKGNCREDRGYSYNFRCRCDDGWKRTTIKNTNEDDFQFLPCIIPESCYGVYCGEGACIKNTDYTHICQCNYGYNNILGIPVFPCFRPCALGSDCSRLGIKITNDTYRSPFDNQVQIHNVIGIIGDIRLTAVQSQLGFAIQFSEHLLEAEEIVFPAELDDLDGHCETRPAEPRDELRVVDDHHELVGRGLHHFLAEEGAAAALDEVQIRIDLVGAVDR
nr:neurogenic locus notch-like protein [Ipomoea batatas]